jgi:hypothetical protein
LHLLSPASRAARPDDDPVLVFLEAYTPVSMPAERWAVVGPFVREQIARLDVSMPYARYLTSDLARLASWCVDQHIELEVERVLDPDTIERFAVHGIEGYSETSQATLRADLRRIAPPLTKDAPWAPAPMALRGTKLDPPYSSTELVIIARDVRRQRTDLQRQTGRATMALGLGCGLDNRWIHKIHGPDVFVEDGVVFVSVPEPTPRIVPVRAALAEEILALKDLAGDGRLTGRTGSDRNMANRVAAEFCIDQNRIRLEPTRLRTGWLVAQLEARTSLVTLVAAAGVKSCRALEPLLGFVTPPAAAEAISQLRSA